MALRKRQFKWILFALLFTVAVLFASGVVVYAEIIINKPSSLLSDQFSIDSYNSYMYAKKGFWATVMGISQVEAIHGIINLLFSLQKVMWDFIDKALKYMFEADALKELTTTITAMTDQLWETFRDNYVPVVIVIALCMIAVTFALKSSQQAIKQLGKLMLVLFLSMTWFANGEAILTVFNDFSTDLQADIMSSAGNTEIMNEIDTSEGGMTDSVTVVRNLYFDQVIQKPYYLMNYGTARKKSIEDNKNYGNPNEFLRKKMSADDKEKIESDVEDKSEKNPYLSGDKIGYKFSVVFFSGLTLILYSLPLFVIAFLNMLLQLGALLMYYALPLLAMISLIPQYSNAIINGIVKVLQLLLMKAVLGLGILIISLLTLAIDTLFKPTILAMFMLNMVIKGLTLIVSWKARDKILQVITNNLVQSAAPKVINENMAKAKNKIDQKVGQIWGERGTHLTEEEKKAQAEEEKRRNDPDMIIHVRSDGFDGSDYQRTAQSQSYTGNPSEDDVFDGEFEEMDENFYQRTRRSPMDDYEDSYEFGGETLALDYEDGEIERMEQEVEVEPVYDFKHAEDVIDGEFEELDRQEQIVDVKANYDQENLDKEMEQTKFGREKQEIDQEFVVHETVDKDQVDSADFDDSALNRESQTE
ncbi:CD3337/EF1877 family mobilome membrane protein [Enterococcus faecalis]|uniref:CD3337/EF1877 family mobilome membrane protein n=1 Tax=Enterococcus faecalis TaxID=1351 RepID=UPI001E5A34F6|nr:hypothetical protein [Enterococcus faecalis]MCD4978451.1 hypothetical protein [Enterococcus faecalis]